MKRGKQTEEHSGRHRDREGPHQQAAVERRRLHELRQHRCRQRRHRQADNAAGEQRHTQVDHVDGTMRPRVAPSAVPRRRARRPIPAGAQDDNNRLARLAQAISRVDAAAAIETTSSRCVLPSRSLPLGERRRRRGPSVWCRETAG